MDSPAGIIFHAARTLLESLFEGLVESFTSKRAPTQVTVLVKDALCMLESAFESPLDGLFLGVHAASESMLSGEHYWGLIVKTNRKIAGLQLLDPAHVSMADAGTAESIIQRCQEWSPAQSEWRAVRDRIVQPLLLAFLKDSRERRVKNARIRGTQGVFLRSYLAIEPGANTSNAPAPVADVAKIFKQCLDGA